MSAWNVYWVMQLDSIGVGLLMFGVASVFVGLAFFSYVASVHDRVSACGVMSVLFAFVLWTVCMFLPSSRTAAAMIVLPAITSAEVRSAVAPEAKELYELAKDALRSVGKPAPEKKEH